MYNIYYVCQDNWWVLLVWPKTYYIEYFFPVDTWRSKVLFILRRAICVSIFKKKHINHHEIFVNAVSLFNDWRSGLKKLWFHVEWGGFYFHQAHQTNVFYQENVVFSRTTPAGRPLLTASAATARCSWDLEGAMRAAAGVMKRVRWTPVFVVVGL